MTRLRRSLVLAIAVIALGSLAACDFEVDDLIVNLGDTKLSDSKNPEVKKVADARESEWNSMDADRSRDDFLGQGDADALADAVRRKPDDPNLRAYQVVQDTLSDDRTHAERNKRELVRTVTEQLRAEGKSVDERIVKREVSRQTVLAEARMLAHTDGKIVDPGPGEGRTGLLYDLYCHNLDRHTRRFPNDEFLADHHEDYGYPCKPRAA